jgi:type I restriction enzyme S subunit
MKTASEMRSLGVLIESRVIEVTNGFPFGGHNENGSGVPHIRPFNVTTSGEVSLEQIKSIPAEAAEGRPRLERGDIVFNNTNTKELVGKCAVWDRDDHPVFSNHMTRIRVCDPEWDAAYLSFAILHHWMVGKSEMLARAHVAQASIMGERFREIDVPPHCPEDQHAIAAVLASVRECCRSDVRQERHAQELKAAAMRDIFTRGLHGEMEQETEIGPIPASWDLVTFADAREWLQYGTSTRCTLEPGGYPVLRIPNVGSGSVSTDELKYCDLPEDEASNYLLEDGDLLFIRTNGVLDRLGSCAVYSGSPKRALFASYLIRARLKSIAEPKFVAHFYGSARGTSLVAGRATPAADGKYNLNTGTIDSLPLPLPKTRDEQREIVAILDAIDSKVDLHRRKKAAFEELFKSLLHKLMTGTIRVADLNLSALPSPEEARA